MFDSLVSATSGTRGAGGVGAWARVENAACARRLATMVTVLDDAYAASGSDEREMWYLDNWAAVAIHIGAAQTMTPAAAEHQLLVAVSLRDRFPKVREVFMEGLVTFDLIRTIISRTRLVADPDALRELDDKLASALRQWEPMSRDRAANTVDAIIAEVDPRAVPRTKSAAKSRSVDVTIDDGSGTAELFAVLFAHDAVALDGRLSAMADTVCQADPRTKDQRRADAIGAIAQGADRLACLCEQPDCPASENPPSTGTVVYVIAHRDTVDTPPEPVAAEAECNGLDGPPPPLFDRPLSELTLREALTHRDSGGASVIRPGALMGGRFLPGAVTRRAALNAKLVAIVHPGQAPPELRYRPSKKLADFVRCRDLTCRFPGCKVPATNCDVDHTIPYPYGPTQAANLKCYCRHHHLWKTFWIGENGWRERQFVDGTVELTSPSGEIYRTTPGSKLLFPELCAPTAPVTAAEVPASAPDMSGLMMPRRKITRAQERAHRVLVERELNGLLIEADDVARDEAQVDG